MKQLDKKDMYPYHLQIHPYFNTRVPNNEAKISITHGKTTNVEAVITMKSNFLHALVHHPLANIRIDGTEFMIENFKEDRMIE